MMKKKKLGIAAALFLIVLGLAWFIFVRQSLPSDVEVGLNSATDLKLLSIDPDEYDVDGHEIIFKADEPHILGYRILGETLISSPDVRSKVIGEVNAIVAHGNKFSSLLCFNPRHDIRFTFKGSIYDLLICYHCQNMEILKDGVGQPSIGISGSSDQFNTILKNANVPLPVRAHRKVTSDRSNPVQSPTQSKP